MNGAAFNQLATNTTRINENGDSKSSASASEAEPEWLTLPETFNDVMKLRGLDEPTQEVEFDEPEPEWLNFPVSRYDIIDLQGFEDDERSNSM